ncbi:hypothetical protein ACIGBH_29985 [Streptomyces sp. NPDC085929]|uniref:hypothetical protein n=1 Tax=Streptomyces sp. NPDC085929 TaxID=3365739 RepID=UPI0037CE8908
MSLSVLGLLITLIPSVRRAMGPWWLAPPVLLGPHPDHDPGVARGTIVAVPLVSISNPRE